MAGQQCPSLRGKFHGCKDASPGDTVQNKHLEIKNTKTLLNNNLLIT